MTTQENDHGGNPWLRVPPADYEGHMNSPGVNQLEPLGVIFSDVYARFKPSSLAIIGCATGNGFEHVDAGVTKRLVGIDINPVYLDIARERYRRLEPILELICMPVESCDFPRGAFDLVHAGLVFEYLDPADALAKTAEWLSPGGVLSIVLQLPSAECGPVSKSAFESVKILESVLHLVPPEELERLAGGAGLWLVEKRKIPLHGGKSFFAAIFRKE
ncbi:MAG: class I SAM-dependent methyltransferase [Chitinivibrionia bacterium]|nr:class I SAM-dependent methyltransferase [Chitinivibrionia bacterium]